MATTEFRGLAALFGLSPSDRTRIGLQAVKRRKLDDEMNRLFGPNNRRTD